MGGEGALIIGILRYCSPFSCSVQFEHASSFSFGETDFTVSSFHVIVNNYSLKSRYIFCHYFTEIEENNCFSICTRSDLKRTKYRQRNHQK